MTALDWSVLPELGLSRSAHVEPSHLLVVVAHPDDETLSVGGLITTAASADLPTTVIVATDGEGSHPCSPTHSPADLATLRRAEVRRAVHTLHPQAHVALIGLADGSLSTRIGTLTAEVCARVADTGPGTLLVSTWRHDGHPDHDAIGSACAAAAARTGVRHLEAPIWAWEWSPESIPVAHLVRVSLTEAALRQKRAALQCHRSQLEPLSGDPADAAVVTAGLLAHFSQPFEAFIDSALADGSERPGAAFDAMYDEGPDPWGFEDSWYEQRKRSILLATLIDLDLGRVLEIGPATGLLTVALAERAERVCAIEVSSRALEHLADRLDEAGLRERVDRIPGSVPGTWAEGDFDTIVISEVGYFLTEPHWRRTLLLAADSLTPTGSMVVVNWLHPVEGLDLDGAAADRIAAETLGLETVVEHRETDFVLRVLRRPGQLSPASAEGRAQPSAARPD